MKSVKVLKKEISWENSKLHDLKSSNIDYSHSENKEAPQFRNLILNQDSGQLRSNIINKQICQSDRKSPNVSNLRKILSPTSQTSSKHNIKYDDHIISNSKTDLNLSPQSRKKINVTKLPKIKEANKYSMINQIEKTRSYTTGELVNSSKFSNKLKMNASSILSGNLTDRSKRNGRNNTITDINQDHIELQKASYCSEYQIRAANDSIQPNTYSEIQPKKKYNFEEPELSKYAFKKQNLFKDTNEIIDNKEAKKISLIPKILQNSASITLAENQLSGKVWKKKNKMITELKNRILSHINLESGYYCSYFIKIEKAIFPIVIRIFTDAEEEHMEESTNNECNKMDNEIEIAIGVDKPPDHNNNLKINFGKRFVIDQFLRDNYIFSTNSKIYITVFAYSKLRGHIGALFKGVKVASVKKQLKLIQSNVANINPNKLVEDLNDEILDVKEYISCLQSNDKELHYKMEKECSVKEDNFDRYSQKSMSVKSVRVQLRCLNCNNFVEDMSYYEMVKLSLINKMFFHEINNLNLGNPNNIQKLKNDLLSNKKSIAATNFSTVEQTSDNNDLENFIKSNTNNYENEASPEKKDTYFKYSKNMNSEHLKICSQSSLQEKLSNNESSNIKTQRENPQNSVKNQSNSFKIKTSRTSSKAVNNKNLRNDVLFRSLNHKKNLLNDELSKSNFDISKIRELINSEQVTNLIYQIFSLQNSHGLNMEYTGLCNQCLVNYNANLCSNDLIASKKSNVFIPAPSYISSNIVLAENYNAFSNLKDLTFSMKCELKQNLAHNKKKNERLIRRNELLSWNDKRLQMRQEKMDAIDSVIDFGLFKIFKYEWFKIFKYYRILQQLKELVAVKHKTSLRQTVEKLMATKIQKYFKKKLLWRSLLNPQVHIRTIVKHSLQMHCFKIREKVDIANRYKLAYHFPKFVRVLRMKFCCQNFISKKKFIVTRMREHFKNKQENQIEFLKNMNKSIQKLVEFERDVKLDKKILSTKFLFDVAGNIFILTQENQIALFFVVYNIKLLDFIRNDYYKKKEIRDAELQNKRKQTETDIYSVNNADMDDLPNIESEKEFNLEKIVQFIETTEVIKRLKNYKVWIKSKEKYKHKAYAVHLPPKNGNNYQDDKKNNETFKSKRTFKQIKEEEKSSKNIKVSSRNIENNYNANLASYMYSESSVKVQKPKIINALKCFAPKEHKKFKIKFNEEFYDYLILSMIECYYVLEKNVKPQNQPDEDINVIINRLKLNIQNLNNTKHHTQTGFYSIAAEMKSSNMRSKNMIGNFFKIITFSKEHDARKQSKFYQDKEAEIEIP